MTLPSRRSDRGSMPPAGRGSPDPAHRGCRSDATRRRLSCLRYREHLQPHSATTPTCAAAGRQPVRWEAIKFSREVTRHFDFEGSMLEPVKRFFRLRRPPDPICAPRAQRHSQRPLGLIAYDRATRASAERAPRSRMTPRAPRAPSRGPRDRRPWRLWAPRCPRAQLRSGEVNMRSTAARCAPGDRRWS